MSPVLNPYVGQRSLRRVALNVFLALPALLLAIQFSGARLFPVSSIAYIGSGLSILAIGTTAVKMLRNRSHDCVRRLWHAAGFGVRSFSITVILTCTLKLITPAMSYDHLLAIGGVVVLPWILVGRMAVDTFWPDLARDRIVILGTGELAVNVARELWERSAATGRLIGFIKEETFENCSDLPGAPILGAAAAIESIVADNSISRVIVALDNRWGILPVAALVRLRFLGIEVEDAQTTIASVTGRISLATVRPAWLIFTGGFRRSFLTLSAKRLMDIIFGVLGLVLAFPIMILVAIAIRLESDGPILYRQTRVGWRSRTFDVLKFRSMRVDAERNGAVWAAVGDSRVTRVGRFIRKYRLDELPQFLNILKGEMSLVGPRPERPVFVQDLRKQIDYYDERHSMRPGLTGWAQVRYPYGASVADAYRKLEYDLFYLKHASVAFDFAIMAATIRVVLGGKHGR